MRTFLGISLPYGAKEELARICFGLEEIRWLDPENFHLTLVFLGELDRDQLENVSEICSQIRFLPFILDVQGVGVFGHKSPEVLYASATLTEELKNLQKIIDSSLRRSGFSIEKRDYKPHITIGRFRKSQDRKLEMYLEEFQSLHLSGISVSEFHLFSSRNGPDGPIYSVEETYPFELE